MKKAKRYAIGGSTTPGAYPFPQSLNGAGAGMAPNTPVVGNVQAPMGAVPFLGSPPQVPPQMPQQIPQQAMKRGGAVKRMAEGGSVNPPFTQEPSKGKTKAELAAEAASKPARPDPKDKDIFTADKMGKDKKAPTDPEGAKAKGGAIKKMARGGGIEQRGKTRGRMV